MFPRPGLRPFYLSLTFRVSLSPSCHKSAHMLEFDHKMAEMDARTFMKEVLRKQLDVSTLVMGYDHRFGHGGGSHEDYINGGRNAA